MALWFLDDEQESINVPKLTTGQSAAGTNNNKQIRKFRLELWITF